MMSGDCFDTELGFSLASSCFLLSLLGERSLSPSSGSSCSVTIASGIVLARFLRSLGVTAVDLYLADAVSGTQTPRWPDTSGSGCFNFVWHLARQSPALLCCSGTYEPTRSS